MMQSNTTSEITTAEVIKELAECQILLDILATIGVIPFEEAKKISEHIQNLKSPLFQKQLEVTA